MCILYFFFHVMVLNMYVTDSKSVLQFNNTDSI